MSIPPPANDTLLLVDDNATNLQVLFKTLQPLGHKLLIARNGQEALAIARKTLPSVILLDVMMPVMDGWETCQRLKDDPETRDISVIFLSALGEVESKVRGLDLGAVDFITKPFRAEEVVARVRTQVTLQQLRRQLRRELNVARAFLREAQQRVEGPLLGQSLAVRTLKESIQQAAETDETVALVGVPGSGEEAVARTLHALSSRSDRPFVYVSAAGLRMSHTTMLFGQAEADEADDLPARAELAEGGTLFLDGLRDAPETMQEQVLKLLTKLREQRAKGERPTPDVRVVAAFPFDLSAAGARGTLGALWAEISQRKIAIPSLADRGEDVIDLARFFIEQQSRRLGKILHGMTPETEARLLQYRWPGSVRELQNVIERQVAIAQSSSVHIESLDGGVALGGYRLVRQIGKGAMGEVWEAKHQLLARPAAVKLVYAAENFGSESHEQLIERFRREAHVLANLRSPHTVSVYDFGITDEGNFFLVMELLDGMDLATMVERHGPIAPARVVALLAQACRSLAEAHAAGLVHRDIKPANLFVAKLGGEFDFLKLLDFGIAKRRGESQGLTRTGSIVGTPGYIAPEIAMGVDIVPQSDLYSLGCVAWHLLTGREVFTHKDMLPLLMKHMTEAPPAPSSVNPAVPPELDAVVLRLLAKRPEQRYATATEAEEALLSVPVATPWREREARAWWDSHVLSSDEVQISAQTVLLTRM